MKFDDSFELIRAKVSSNDQQQSMDDKLASDASANPYLSFSKGQSTLRSKELLKSYLKEADALLNVTSSRQMSGRSSLRDESPALASFLHSTDSMGESIAQQRRKSVTETIGRRSTTRNSHLVTMVENEQSVPIHSRLSSHHKDDDQTVTNASDPGEASGEAGQRFERSISFSESKHSPRLHSRPKHRLWHQSATYKVHLAPVRSIVFHPTDASTFFTASEDETIQVNSIKHTEAASMALRGHTGAVTSLAVDSQGQYVYSGGLDATVRQWRCPSAADFSTNGFPSKPAKPNAIVGHADAVWDLSLANTGDDVVLASASADGTVKTWNAGEGLDSLPMLMNTIWYTGCHSGDASFDEENRSVLRRPTSLDWCFLDSFKLVVGYRNSCVKVFDIKEGKQVLAIKDPTSKK